MNRSLIALIALVPVLACDPREPAKNDGSPGAAKGGGALAARTDGAPAPADAAQPVRFDSLSECLASCERADVIPTNRETCRLNCDTAYGARTEAAGAAGAAGTAGTDAIGRAANCMGTCYAGAGPREACVSDCKSGAAEGAGAPAADVLNRLDLCISTCQLDNTRPTNRETCELNCAQAARVAATPPPAGVAAATPSPGGAPPATR